MKIRASTDLYENTNLDICERSNHAIQLLIQNFQNKHFWLEFLNFFQRIDKFAIKINLGFHNKPVYLSFELCLSMLEVW